MQGQIFQRMDECLEASSFSVHQWSFSVTPGFRCMDQEREHVRMIKVGTELSLFVTMEVSDLHDRNINCGNNQCALKPLDTLHSVNKRNQTKSYCGTT